LPPHSVKERNRESFIFAWERGAAAFKEIIGGIASPDDRVPRTLWVSAIHLNIPASKDNREIVSALTAARIPGQPERLRMGAIAKYWKTIPPRRPE
jgi:hypothetical protein